MACVPLTADADRTSGGVAGASGPPLPLCRFPNPRVLKLTLWWRECYPLSKVSSEVDVASLGPNGKPLRVTLGNGEGAGAEAHLN